MSRSSCVRILVSLILASVLCLGITAVIFPPFRGEATSGELLAALKEAAIPLNSAQPGGDFGDLQFLKPILADKPLVALGEATHGTREFFTMKHRLLQFLVVEMDYRVFCLEAVVEDAEALSHYVADGTGDPRAALSQVYMPWHTQEVLDLVEWMRAYNARPDTTEKIRLVGFDPYAPAKKSDQVMAENIQRLYQESGGEKLIIWAHNMHIAKDSEESMGYFLKQMFGDEVYLIGFEFSEGDFLSRTGLFDYTPGIFHKPAAPGGFYAHTLAQVNEALLFLDFAAMQQNPVLQQWLAQDYRSYNIDEMYYQTRFVPKLHTLDVSWLDLYDGLIFVRQTTAARPLDGR